MGRPSTDYIVELFIIAGFLLSFRSIEGFVHCCSKKYPTLAIFSLPDTSVFIQPLYAKGKTKDDDFPEFSVQLDDDEDVKSSVTAVKGKTEKTSTPSTTRWGSLNPQIKKRIVEEGQQRAIRNKQKREPLADKKRRLMMFYKDSEVRRRQEARVTRPLPTNSPDRIPLSQITPGSELKGVVISLVDFGAYVDVQSECDGLLHISQITRTDFISHPKVVFQPGDAVTVRVLRVSPELKKLQLTMLSALEIEKLQEEQEDDVDEERIQLEDLAVDDELWGEIKRVTSFGAFVELGAKVDGFLHFMDHPEFGQVPGAKPSSFMKVNDRIRCWVSDIDSEKSRIKLTANRPPSLPGPRREIKSM